jgi:hypothetical protein
MGVPDVVQYLPGWASFDHRIGCLAGISESVVSFISDGLVDRNTQNWSLTVADRWLSREKYLCRRDCYVLFVANLAIMTQSDKGMHLSAMLATLQYAQILCRSSDILRSISEK